MIVRQVGRFSRECGCAWDIVPPSEQSDRTREASRGRPVARFTHRCAEHAPMCRSLESWELKLLREPEGA